MNIKEYYVIMGFPSDHAVDINLWAKDSPIYISRYDSDWNPNFRNAATFDTKEQAMQMLCSDIHITNNLAVHYCDKSTWQILKVTTTLEPVVVTDSDTLHYHINSAKKKLSENELAAIKTDILSSVNLCRCE